MWWCSQCYVVQLNEMFLVSSVITLFFCLNIYFAILTSTHPSGACQQSTRESYSTTYICIRQSIFENYKEGQVFRRYNVKLF